MMSFPSKAFLFGHVVIGLFYTTLLFYAWQADPWITAENRLMENLQAASLLLAMAFSLFNLAPLRGKAPDYLSAGLGVFFLTLLLRELDIEKLGLPGILTFMGSGGGRHLLLGVLWGAFVLAMARNRYSLKRDVLAHLGSPFIYYLLAAAIFYLIGDALDKKLLPLGKPERVFWEETAECLAALWFFLGTLVWTVDNMFRLRPPFAGDVRADEIR